MALDLLDTEATRRAVLDLIKQGRRDVWLVSPFVKLGRLKVLGRYICEAMAAGARVSMVIRDEPKQVNGALQYGAKLVESGMRLYAVDGLHAKIYWSESHAVLTSLNLLDTSFDKCVEVGMLVRETKAHAQVREFIDSLELRAVAGVAERGATAAARVTPARASRAGFCIRCQKSVPHDRKRPYCRRDFEVWDRFEDVNYQDRFCHGCGKAHAASMREPFCAACGRLDRGRPPLRRR